MNKFHLKIIIPTVLSVLLFLLTFFFVIVPRFQQQMMTGKQEMIKELTNSAWSILSKYENDEREGLLTREEAQQTAVKRIQYLRYGDEFKDYFWITDMHPTMIMHPFRSDLNGKDLSEFTDPHGNKMFVEMVRTVEKDGQGYVNYMWQWKDDSLHIVPKLSYVKLFKPWNWIIGTGIYIEDVRKEMSALTRRMLWISVSISFVIALLLFYIIKQSLKIERLRAEAEEELQHAKEKYFTLVEAATEGLIMLIDGKISFANTVISKLSGFSNSELTGLTLIDIISKNNNQFIQDTFSENHVKPGKYELNLKKKSGGFAEVLLSSSTAMFSGKLVDIIIIKDISIEKTSGFTAIDYQQLISSLDLGFFKARIDGKGKMIFANEIAIKILGHNNLEDLHELNILDFVSQLNDRKSLKAAIIEEGFIKNKVVQIIKKDQTFATVVMSLIALESSTSEGIICDGIIEDISAQVIEKQIQEETISALKANEFVLEQDITDFLSPLLTLPDESQLSQLIDFFNRKKVGHVLLTNVHGHCVGIVTKSDIQQRILRLNLKVDNPAYLIMSAPVVYGNDKMSVFEALHCCEENSCHHLPVKNHDGQIIGVFCAENVNTQLFHSLFFLRAKIKKAETIEQLQFAHNELQRMIKPLILSELAVKNLTNITSLFFDMLLQRSIQLSIEVLGPAPVEFSFICMGSEGRKEETLLTDQDNAIIYADVPKEKEEPVKAYFLALGKSVCAALDKTGYRYCTGNIMAMNPKWCVSLTHWKNYFADWIASPEPQSLLDAMIFFDFRTVYGAESLSASLRQTIDYVIKEHPGFLYHMAHNTYYTKPQQIASTSLISDKSTDFIDLKSALVPLTMLARTYAFQHQLRPTNTRERLMAIKEKQLIKAPMIDEMLFTYDYLMKLRFKNQAGLLAEKQAASNQIYLKKINDIEIQTLKRILAAIQEFQAKIKHDFRIST